MRRILSSLASLCLIGAILLPTDNIYVSVAKGLLATSTVLFTIEAARAKS